MTSYNQPNHTNPNMKPELHLVNVSKNKSLKKLEAIIESKSLEESKIRNKLPELLNATKQLKKQLENIFELAEELGKVSKKIQQTEKAYPKFEISLKESHNPIEIKGHLEKRGRDYAVKFTALAKEPSKFTRSSHNVPLENVGAKEILEAHAHLVGEYLAHKEKKIDWIA